MDMDVYLMRYVLPQVPREHQEFRMSVRQAMHDALFRLYMAATTSGRTRQTHLVGLKTELALVEVYVEEIREVCYKGKMRERFTPTVAKRFEVLAGKQKEAMGMVWGWIKNEEEKAKK